MSTDNDSKIIFQKIKISSLVLTFCGLMMCLMVVFLTIALSLHLACVNPITDWNNRAIETTCTVNRHYIEEASYCSKKCYINNDVSFEDCYKPCQNGYIVVNYLVNYLKQTQTIKVINAVFGKTHVENLLSSEYPDGGQLNCYYDSSNPPDVELQLKNSDVCFGFAITFDILIILVFLIGMFLILCNIKIK